MKKSRARIEAIATDMGLAYISAVQANLPDATLVFDHFHTIKLFSEKLTKRDRAWDKRINRCFYTPFL